MKFQVKIFFASFFLGMSLVYSDEDFSEEDVGIEMFGDLKNISFKTGTIKLTPSQIKDTLRAEVDPLHPGYNLPKPEVSQIKGSYYVMTVEVLWEENLVGVIKGEHVIRPDEGYNGLFFVEPGSTKAVSRSISVPKVVVIGDDKFVFLVKEVEFKERAFFASMAEDGKWILREIKNADTFKEKSAQSPQE